MVVVLAGIVDGFHEPGGGLCGDAGRARRVGGLLRALRAFATAGEGHRDDAAREPLEIGEEGLRVLVGRKGADEDERALLGRFQLAQARGEDFGRGRVVAPVEPERGAVARGDLVQRPAGQALQPRRPARGPAQTLRRWVLRAHHPSTGIISS